MAVDDGNLYGWQLMIANYAEHGYSAAPSSPCGCMAPERAAYSAVLNCRIDRYKNL